MKKIFCYTHRSSWKGTALGMYMVFQTTRDMCDFTSKPDFCLKCHFKMELEPPFQRNCLIYLVPSVSGLGQTFVPLHKSQRQGQQPISLGVALLHSEGTDLWPSWLVSVGVASPLYKWAGAREFENIKAPVSQVPCLEWLGCVGKTKPQSYWQCLPWIDLLQHRAEEDEKQWSAPIGGETVSQIRSLMGKEPWWWKVV